MHSSSSSTNGPAERTLTPGARIRRARMMCNWSQPTLAAAVVRVAADCNRPVPETATLANMISKWERDDREPDQLYRHLLAIALKVAVEDLGLAVDPDFQLFLPRRGAGVSR